MVLIYLGRGGGVRSAKGMSDVLVVTSKVIGLEVNVDKTNHIIKCRDENAGRSYCVKMVTVHFKVLADVSYLGTNLINQNSVQGEIKSRLR
jgi:hypothetical protein